MRKSSSVLTLAMALTAASALPAARADDTADPLRDAFYRQGWYVAPMVSYAKVDTARSTSNGSGAALVLGNRGEVASLEVFAHYLSLPWSGGPATLTGGGFDLAFGPYGDLPVVRTMFGLVGMGLHKRKDHPYYASDDSTIFADAGAGYFFPLRLFDRAMALRAETRYRLDNQPPPRPAGTQPNYHDWIVSLGLQIPLGDEPSAPVPETVAVVPVAETPAPAPEPAPVVETPPAPAPAPEPAGPPTVETAKAGDTIVLEGVNFETGKAKLTANAQTILDGVAAKLVARPELKVEIGGHTDARGSDTYNQQLSERRAQSVVAYLTAHGVDGARLSAHGYGESQPIDSNETDEGREKNRRVEMKIVESSEEQH